jgi:ribosomal-protein-alanine N-acetyltransferase
MNFVRSVTQSSFIGYALFNKYWGFGYAEESVNALIEIAFRDHKLHRVVAGIEPDNKRSIKLAKKLGFRKEGISKRVVLLRGKWQDLIQFALTTEDKNIKWSGQVEIRKR